MHQAPQVDLVINATTLDGWRNERKALVADRDKIDAKIEKLDAKLKAAAVLMDLPAEESVVPQSPSVESDNQTEPMTTAIVRVLTNTTKSLTRSEIRDELRKDPELAARLDRTPNSFYNGMKRLVGRNAIMEVPGERFTVPAKE